MQNLLESHAPYIKSSQQHGKISQMEFFRGLSWVHCCSWFH